MKKQKGFTLIELLAIIVILAIIAVITVPIILNVIDNAKRGTAKDSAYGYKDAINKYYVSGMLEENDIKLDGNYTVNENGELSNATTTHQISFSGTKPTNGYLKFEKKQITSGCLTIDGYKVTFKDGEVENVVEGQCELVPEQPTNPDTPPTQDSTPVSNFFIVSNDGVIKFDNGSFEYEDENGDSQWNTDLLQSSGWYDIKTLNIPSDYNGITVTSIGKFSNIWDISDNLSVVNVPNSVTSLKHNCCQIDDLTWNVSDSLTFIEENAFYDSNNHTLVYNGTSESFKNNVVIENIFSNISGIPNYIRCTDGVYNTDALYDMRDTIVTDQVYNNFKVIIDDNCDLYECDGTLKQLEEAANISIDFK